MANIGSRWVLAGIGVLAAFAMLAPAAHAKTGIALVSDLHAYYGNLEVLMKQIAYERQRFYTEDPTGTFIVVFNGDNAGLSAYSHYFQDNGDLIYRYYNVLAAEPRTRLVVGLGNHDDFDIEGAEGNELFYAHAQRLVAHARRFQGEDFALTNGNLGLTEVAKQLITPARDIETAQGKVRVVGFVLDEFFKKCGYSRTDGRQLFTGLTPINELVDQMLADAVASGVRVLLPMGHDYTGRLVAVKAAFEAANAKLPLESQVRIPWAFAAHDHIQSVSRGVLNAGSNGGMVFATIENDGTAGVVRPYRSNPPGKKAVDVAAVWNTDAHLSREEKAFLDRYRPKIEAIREKLATVVGYAPRRFARKELVKRGPEESGIWMADVLARWASDRSTRAEERPVQATFGFWNSSSYRYDYDIEEGDPITLETQFGVYPLAGRRPRRGKMFGSVLIALYASARRERMLKDTTHTPQLSSNLREVSAVDKGNAIALEWFDENHGRWLPISPSQRYRLGMDGFLASDGYDIPGWKTLLAQVDWDDEVQPPMQRELTLALGPGLLLPHPPCAKALAYAAEAESGEAAIPFVVSLPVLPSSM